MKYLLSLCITTLLFGCSSIDVIQYQNNTPQLSLFDYFQGKTKGWGMVQDRKGNLTRQFVVIIDGKINGSNDLVLEESFDWSDGEKSKRTWTITADGIHTFTGKASDVVGIASGEAYGNALNWKYHLNVVVDDSTWKIFLDDWMFLQTDNVLINKTAMSKFGFHVGDITIVFRKDIN